MITGLPMPDAVTVLVSTELLAVLEAGWSPPVQIQVRRTPGIGSGYEMIARTHRCAPALTPDLIERYCEAMHDAYERAAVGAGWETQQASRKPWSEVPEPNKTTMRAAVAALLGLIEDDRAEATHD